MANDPIPETPAVRGFRMPAEWEPHAATWLAWPHRESDWPGKFAPISWVYAEIVKTLTRHEPVNLVVEGGKAGDRAFNTLARAGADVTRVEFWELPTDRSWVRDSGPIFVVNAGGERAVLDWHFNAWAKYPDWTRDDRLPGFVAGRYRLSRWQPRLRGWRVVLEGGGIDVNGRGLMLTTEECLLSTIQHRNPPLDREDYEQVFADFLGVRKTIWLGRGVAGDDTHGHVDDLARFVNPTTVVLVTEGDPADENYEPLEAATDLDGNRLTVVPLPMPRRLVFDGQRLPASYANFYIANGVVIVPTFNDPADRVALGTLADLFPDREVVGIHCTDLVWGLGTLHCMTQQEPAAQMPPVAYEVES
jgi:agmatine deiminase